MPDIKSMTLAEAKAYQSELKRQGRTPSTSKEAGKVADYIATLEPERFGEERVTEAYRKLTRGVTERGGFTESVLPELEARGIPNILDPVGTFGAGDLGGFLGDFQSGVFDAASSPELRESILQQLEPDRERPEPLNRVALFEDLREQYGVGDLETLVNELKATREDEIATDRARRQAQEGQPVPLGVIAGRISEIERQTAERIDALNRQINTATDQLNTAYGMIETYINLYGLDYQDAVSAYNEEFNRNLQIYKLVDEELDQQQATARANLQLFQNAITAGNINYDDLSSDQRAFIHKMEAQSGLPIGFTSALKSEYADGKIISTTTRTSGGQKFADVIMRMEDGSLRTETVPLGTVTTGDGSGVNLTTKDSDMRSKLSSLSGADGNVSPDDWLIWMRRYQADTGKDEEDFVFKFSQFMNLEDRPERYQGYTEHYLGEGNRNNTTVIVGGSG